MALWGNKDSKTASGTVRLFANGLVTGVSTSFTTETAVNDYIKIGSDYIVSSITNTTSLHVVSGTAGGTITANAAGTAYTLSDKPISITFSEVPKTKGSGQPSEVFGVDTTEVGVTHGAGHAGWVRRIAGTGGRNGRVQYETLVAGSSITGDQADDTEFADS